MTTGAGGRRGTAKTIQTTPPHGEAVEDPTQELKKLLLDLDFKFGSLSAKVDRMTARETELTLELAAVTDRKSVV